MLSQGIADINQSAIGNNDTPIYENLGNYELEVDGDNPDLEEDPEWEDIDDEAGGVELDLSLKRSNATTLAVRAALPNPSFLSSRTRKPRPLPPLPVKAKKMPNPNVPKPGPAKLTKNAGLPEWLEEAKQCHYLPEAAMKQLCEMVKECLMEGTSYCSILR